MQATRHVRKVFCGRAIGGFGQFRDNSVDATELSVSRHPRRCNVTSRHWSSCVQTMLWSIFNILCGAVGGRWHHRCLFVRMSTARSTAAWFGPPVLTLRQAEFDAVCADLMRLVEADYSPTLLVGIRTGGLLVAESMMRAASSPLAMEAITCRRAATGTKSRVPLLHTVLATLPRPAVDLLRRVEHRMLTERRGRNAALPHIDAAELDVIGRWLAACQGPQRILVADDAVDSGVTLETVLRHLHGICPVDTELRSAAITQTLEQPLIRPDYVLFHGILCRFPWSFDAAD